MSDIATDEEVERLPPEEVIPMFFSNEDCGCGQPFTGLSWYEHNNMFVLTCTDLQCEIETYVYRIQDMSDSGQMIGLYRFAAAFEVRGDMFAAFRDIEPPSPKLVVISQTDLDAAYNRGYADARYDTGLSR